MSMVQASSESAGTSSAGHHGQLELLFGSLTLAANDSHCLGRASTARNNFATLEVGAQDHWEIEAILDGEQGEGQLSKKLRQQSAMAIVSKCWKLLFLFSLRSYSEKLGTDDVTRNFWILPCALIFSWAYPHTLQLDQAVTLQVFRCLGPLIFLPLPLP